MKHLPKVAVVILNWNGKHFLEEFLPSVLKTTYSNADIYVADNGSTDDSIAYLNAHYPQVKQIINDQNYGFASGYNVALKDVEADYFVLLNSDVEVTPAWIEPVVKVLQADESIAVCQPKILAYKQKDHFEYAGAAGGYLDMFGYAFCRGRFFDICEEDKGQYDAYSEIFWAAGAAMFVKADVFKSLAGFDGDFFAHMEEIDLCWRIKRAGYHIMYCPDSVVYHLGGGTLPQGNPRKTYLNFRNNLIMLFKNLPFWQLLLLLPIRLGLDIVAAIKAIIDGQSADCKAILKAQFHFLIGLPKWVGKRMEARRLVKQTKLPYSSENYTGWYSRSIIIDYFFRGKKYFYELGYF